MGESRLATLTIPSGQTESNVLPLREHAAHRSFNAMLFAPAALPETVTIEIQPWAEDAEWVILRSGAEDFTLSAGRADPLIGLHAAKLRLTASAPVGADRVFRWEASAVNR